jgi:hypothetical protein
LGLAVFFFLRGLRDPIGVGTHGRGAARLEGERWVVCRGRAQRRDRLRRRRRKREEAQVRFRVLRLIPCKIGETTR